MPCIHTRLLQPRIKPRDSLHKRRLLRIRLQRRTLIDPDRESMRRAVVQIRLECDVVGLENLLRAELCSCVEGAIEC